MNVESELRESEESKRHRREGVRTREKEQERTVNRERVERKMSRESKSRERRSGGE